jgi:tetratricopeptide (TPR) repeat protein
MADSQRIEDLRRRVQKDPTSIAFAQLAEECRRAGNLQESVDVCRAGLALHPGYLSARVTLGRALIELDDLDSALVELEYVLRSAPENLAAIRGLAEIHHRQGRLTSALTQYRAALLLARNDPDLQRTVDELSYQLEPPAAAEPDEGLSLDEVQNEFLQSLSSHGTATVSEPERDAGTESSQEATPIAGLELEPKAEAKPEPEPEPEQASLAAAIVPALPSEPTPPLVTSPTAVERVDVAEPLEGTPEREREIETEAEPAHALLAIETVPPVPWEAAPALINRPVQVERAEVEELPEDAPNREPEQPEQAPLAASVVQDAVPWEDAPALIPQPVLVERVDPEESPEDTAERDHALRMIAALEQWIDAIHVVRAQPLA